MKTRNNKGDTMSRFNDKDLKRVKKELDKFSCLTLDTEDGRGLIARMEAAEKVCEWEQENIGDDDLTGLEYLDGWLKVAGK